MTSYSYLLLLISASIVAMQNNNYIIIPANKAPENTISMNRYIGASLLAASSHAHVMVNDLPDHIDHTLCWALDENNIYYVKCMSCPNKQVILKGNTK